MSKWTPGPWEFYELDPCRDGLGYIRPIHFDGREIAHHGDSMRSPEENRANGVLIAAAPEMAEILRYVANMRAGNYRMGFWDSLDALLAKIEGAAP